MSNLYVNSQSNLKALESDFSIKNSKKNSAKLSIKHNNKENGSKSKTGNLMISHKGNASRYNSNLGHNHQHCININIKNIMNFKSVSPNKDEIEIIDHNKISKTAKVTKEFLENLKKQKDFINSSEYYKYLTEHNTRNANKEKSINESLNKSNISSIKSSIKKLTSRFMGSNVSKQKSSNFIKLQNEEEMENSCNVLVSHDTNNQENDFISPETPSGLLSKSNIKEEILGLNENLSKNSLSNKLKLNDKNNKKYLSKKTLNKSKINFDLENEEIKGKSKSHKVSTANLIEIKNYEEDDPTKQIEYENIWEVKKGGRYLLKSKIVYDSISESEMSDYEKNQLNENLSVEIHNSVTFPSRSVVYNLVLFYDIFLAVCFILFEFYFLCFNPYSTLIYKLTKENKYFSTLSYSESNSLFIIFDLLFILKLGVKIFTFQYNEEKLVLSLKSFYYFYNKKSFYFFLLICFPFHLTYLAFHSFIGETIFVGMEDYLQGSNSFAKSISHFRLLRILVIIEYNELSAKFTHVFDISIFPKLLLSAFKFIVYAHSLSCIWIYIYRIQDIDFKTHWIREYGLVDYDNFQVYITSFYFNLCTFLTVGYGDITPKTILEFLYSIFLLLFSCGAFSIILSELSTKVNFNENENKKLEKKREIFDNIKSEFIIPNNLNNKINEYMNNSMDINFDSKGVLLDSLPFEIKNELLIKMYSDSLRNLTFFNNTPKDFDAFVVSLLKPYYIEKGEIFYQVGSIFQEMFFVLEGQVEFFFMGINKGKKFFVIRKGQNFGEINIMENETIEYEIRGCTHMQTNILSLNKEDMELVKSNYPELLKQKMKDSVEVYRRMISNKIKIMKIWSAKIKESIKDTFISGGDDEDSFNLNNLIASPHFIVDSPLHERITLQENEIKEERKLRNNLASQIRLNKIELSNSNIISEEDDEESRLSNSYNSNNNLILDIKSSRKHSWNLNISNKSIKPINNKSIKGKRFSFFNPQSKFLLNNLKEINPHLIPENHLKSENALLGSKTNRIFHEEHKIQKTADLLYENNHVAINPSLKKEIESLNEEINEKEIQNKENTIKKVPINKSSITPCNYLKETPKYPTYLELNPRFYTTKEINKKKEEFQIASSSNSSSSRTISNYSSLLKINNTFLNFVPSKESISTKNTKNLFMNNDIIKKVNSIGRKLEKLYSKKHKIRDSRLFLLEKLKSRGNVEIKTTNKSINKSHYNILINNELKKTRDLEVPKHKNTMNSISSALLNKKKNNFNFLGNFNSNMNINFNLKKNLNLESIQSGEIKSKFSSLAKTPEIKLSYQNMKDTILFLKSNEIVNNMQFLIRAKSNFNVNTNNLNKHKSVELESNLLKSGKTFKEEETDRVLNLNSKNKIESKEINHFGCRTHPKKKKLILKKPEEKKTINFNLVFSSLIVKKFFEDDVNFTNHYSMIYKNREKNKRGGREYNNSQFFKQEIEDSMANEVKESGNETEKEFTILKRKDSKKYNKKLLLTQLRKKSKKTKSRNMPRHSLSDFKSRINLEFFNYMLMKIMHEEDENKNLIETYNLKKDEKSSYHTNTSNLICSQQEIFSLNSNKRIAQEYKKRNSLYNKNPKNSKNNHFPMLLSFPLHVKKGSNQVVSKTRNFDYGMIYSQDESGLKNNNLISNEVLKAKINKITPQLNQVKISNYNKGKLLNINYITQNNLKRNESKFNSPNSTCFRKNFQSEMKLKNTISSQKKMQTKKQNSFREINSLDKNKSKFQLTESLSKFKKKTTNIEKTCSIVSDSISNNMGKKLTKTLSKIENINELKNRRGTVFQFGNNSKIDNEFFDHVNEPPRKKSLLNSEKIETNLKKRKKHDEEKVKKIKKQKTLFIEELFKKNDTQTSNTKNNGLEEYLKSLFKTKEV